MLKWVQTSMICIFCVWGAACGILGCSTVGKTLPTAYVTVNVSCTSVVFSNVVVTGVMTLNISIAGIVAANPSSTINVTISSMTVRSGATLAIDSTGYPAEAGGGGLKISIMIQSLIGSDGCLLFLGSFPPGTTLLVSGAHMTSSTASAPMLPDLDPYYGTNYYKMMMLVNVSLTDNSFMIFTKCSLSSSTAIQTFQFYTTGTLPMSFSNDSVFTIRNCTMSASNGWALYMRGALNFSNSSYLAVSSCTLTGEGSVWIWVAVFTSSSSLTISSCNMTGDNAHAFILNSVANFTNFSYLAVSSCNMTGYNRSFYAGRMTVHGWSYVVLTKSSFTGTTFNQVPPIALGWSSPLFIGNSSWILLKGNVMWSKPLYTTCIQNNINFSSTSTTPGWISILDNTCNCGFGCSLWTVSWVSIGGGGKIYQRCNTVNGVSVTYGSPLLPTGTISVGACGSCNASADCFGPLTVINSTCSIITSSKAVVCQCLPVGVTGNMCLPPTVWPFRTATISLSHEMSSNEISVSSSGTQSSVAESISKSATDSRTSSTSLYESVISSLLSLSRTDESPSPSFSAATRGGFSNSVAALKGQTATTAMSSPRQSSPLKSVTPTVSTPTCNLNLTVVLGNISSSLSFSTGVSSQPLPVEGSINSTRAAGEELHTVVARGKSVPMASVLAAAGLALHVDFVVTAGYSLANPKNVSVSLGNVIRAVSHSNNISVDVSLANVQIADLSASHTVRFAVTVETVVLFSAETLVCRTGSVTLEFECFFTSSARSFSVLKSALQTTYLSSTALSSVLGTTVTAMSNTGMVSILTLEECVFSDIDPLDASISPIPFAIGDEVGQHYRGCIIVVIFITFGYFSLALLCVSVVPKFSTTPVDVLGLLRYPSSVMIFVGMFHQGMVSSSVSLLRLANSPLDMLLGSCGLAAATCLTVFMLLAGTRWMQCHATGRSDDETHSSVMVVQLFLDVALWRKHWVDDVRGDGTPSGYKRRYVFILD